MMMLCIIESTVEVKKPSNSQTNVINSGTRQTMMTIRPVPNTLA